MSYATAAEVRTFSGVTEVDAKSDSEINAVVARAERLINAYTRQNFNLTSPASPILVDGSGSVRLVLPQRIVTLSQLRFLIVSDGGTVDDAEVVTDVFIDKGWYLIAGDEQIRLRQRLGKNYGNDAGIIFPCGKQNIEVTGTFGYSSVPSDVNQATCALVERIICNEGDIKAKNSIFKSEKIGNYSYEKADDSNSIKSLLGPEVQLMLRPYIKPVLLARI